MGLSKLRMGLRFDKSRLGLAKPDDQRKRWGVKAATGQMASGRPAR
jgi:hypothetical protein